LAQRVGDGLSYSVAIKNAFLLGCSENLYLCTDVPREVPRR
jgi:hypothetical protein